MSVSYIFEAIVLLIMILFVHQKTVYASLFVVSGLFIEFVGSTVYPRMLLSVP